MKTLFNIVVAVLLVLDVVALAGCAGEVVASAPTSVDAAPASYAIDVCEHTFTAVDRFAAPSCKSGYAVVSTTAEYFEGTQVTSMRDGVKVFGIVPHDASVGASICIHVECAEVGR